MSGCMFLLSGSGNALIRLVDLAKPFIPLLPEVELPYETVTFDDRIVYTLGSAFLYAFLNLPIYGASKNSNDPIYWVRPLFGAEKNSLLEFGVLPIVASGLIFQLLAGLRIIKVNLNSRTDRDLFQTLQKVFSILQYFVLTNLFIFTGYYGYNLSAYSIVWINAQVVGAGFFITLLSEIIDKGYGFGSGALTFTTVSSAAGFVADIIGLNTSLTTRGYERNGAFVNLISNISSKPFKNAIIDSFTRSYLPNLTQVYVVIAIFFAVIYLQNFRIELPIRSNRVRQTSTVYPIKLLYTGALPLYFGYIVLFYLNIIGYAIVNLVFKNDPTQPAVKILGHYVVSGFSSNLIIESPSILYYLTPSNSLFESLTSPIRTITFGLVLIITSAYFANVWSLISGSAPKDIANTFKEQGISLTGRRDTSISKELQRVIPVAAVSGAVSLALLAIVGEIFGAKGRGGAIAASVSAGFAFLEVISAEYQQSGSKNFAQIFGAFQ